MNKQLVSRLAIYTIGMIILAFGVVLNTIPDLGVSPLTAFPFSISLLTGWSYPALTFVAYCLYIVIQVAVHLWTEQHYMIVRDLLQIIVSIVFSVIMSLLLGIIPIFHEAYPGTFWATFWGRLLVILVAILCTGVGAALTLSARLVPNPADGAVQTLAEFFHTSTGLMKNFFDFSCIVIAVAISFIFSDHLLGIGIGTILAMILVGRIIAWFNYLFLPSLDRIMHVHSENPQDPDLFDHDVEAILAADEAEAVGIDSVSAVSTANE